MNLLFKKKVTKKVAEESAVVEELDFDIEFHNYWDIFGNTEIFIKGGAKRLVEDEYAANLIEGAIMFAAVDKGLVHVETREGADGRKTVVFKGDLRHDVQRDA